MRRRSIVAPPPPAVALALDVLWDGPRPGRDDPAADRAWLAGRRLVGQLEVGSRFDPRAVLALGDHEWAAWQAERRLWLAEAL
jgi:hypothetical protein